MKSRVVCSIYGRGRMASSVPERRHKTLYGESLKAVNIFIPFTALACEALRRERS